MMEQMEQHSYQSTKHTAFVSIKDNIELFIQNNSIS